MTEHEMDQFLENLEKFALAQRIIRREDNVDVTDTLTEEERVATYYAYIFDDPDVSHLRLVTGRPR